MSAQCVECRLWDSAANRFRGRVSFGLSPQSLALPTPSIARLRHSHIIISECMTTPTMCLVRRVCPVRGLLFRCCPAAIGRFVVPISVWEPVNRRPFRTLPHIRKEVRELHPPWVNCNPTATVARILRRVLVQTPGFHSDPTHVCRGELTAARMAVAESWVPAAYIRSSGCVRHPASPLECWTR
jgi:hypothetical protein